MISIEKNNKNHTQNIIFKNQKTYLFFFIFIVFNKFFFI